MPGRDNSSVNFTYDGHTNLSVGKNGVSTIGFGSFPVWDCSAARAGCAHEWYDLNPYIIEADIRLNSDHLWQNGTSKGSSYWDIWHTAAHEVGHTIGFGHTSETHQVMWPDFGADSTTNRTLGQGDAKRNNSSY